MLPREVFMPPERIKWHLSIPIGHWIPNLLKLDYQNEIIRMSGFYDKTIVVSFKGMVNSFMGLRRKSSSSGEVLLSHMKKGGHTKAKQR